MTQGFWRLYKAKVLQTLGGARADGALQEEVGWGGDTTTLWSPQSRVTYLPALPLPAPLTGGLHCRETPLS